LIDSDCDETIEAINELTSNIMLDESSDTVHLVRRYESDYVL